MKRILCLVLLLLSSPSFADDLLDILKAKDASPIVKESSDVGRALKKLLPNRSAEQNIFIGFINAGDYKKALYQWRDAFPGRKFSVTPTGKALYGFLLFKNGLEVIGTEHLFSVEDVDKIDPSVKRLWTLSAHREHDVWSYVNVKWQPQWTQIFDVDTEVRVLSRQEIDPENTESILELLKKTKMKTQARTWLQWQMGLSLALKGEVGKSAKVLAHLMKNESDLISKDLIRITVARLLYERGYLNAAIDYYAKVNKDSEYWYVAQEELAWTYLRKGQPQDTLAISMTMLDDSIAPHVGPEMIFLASLSQLKVCDYEGVARNIGVFKKRFQAKAKSLISLTESTETKAINGLVKKLKKGRTSLLSLGSTAIQLPRYVTRDELLLDYVRRESALAKESKIAADLYAKSLSEGTGKVGFQAALEELKKTLEKRSQQARAASRTLIQRRAKEELAEIETVLQKMNIVEAELIQQVSMSERVLTASSKDEGEKKKLSNLPKADKYDLKFPFVGEKWFDELGNYRVDLKKACKGRSAKR